MHIHHYLWNNRIGKSSKLFQCKDSIYRSALLLILPLCFSISFHKFQIFSSYTHHKSDISCRAKSINFVVSSATHKPIIFSWPLSTLILVIILVNSNIHVDDTVNFRTSKLLAWPADLQNSRSPFLRVFSSFANRNNSILSPKVVTRINEIMYGNSFGHMVI